MKKLQDAKLLLYSLGLLISSLIERVITFIIAEHIELEPVIYHTISMILLIVLFMFTNIILKIIVRSKFACKVACGKSYVAGRWLEAVYKDATKEFVGYCCFDIFYNDDGIRVIATNYDRELNVNYTFTSKSASIENYTLSYMYMRNSNGHLIPDWGSISFQKNMNSAPTVYMGHFMRDSELFRFKGFLVREKKDIDLLDENFEAYFKEILIKYSKGYKCANDIEKCAGII